MGAGASQPRSITRRRLLQGLLWAGAGTALAGCLGDGADEAAESASGDASDEPSGGSSVQERSDSSDLRTLTVQHSFALDGALAGLYVAEEQGFYADEGLSVDVVPGAAGVDPVVAVTSGEVDLGIHANASSVMLPFSQGAPIKVFASQYKHSPNGFLSKASTGIEAIEDYDGLRFGTLQTSTSVLEAILNLNDLDGELVIVTFPDLLNALLDGRVDVSLAFVSNFGVRMDLEGIPYTFHSFDELGYEQEFYAYFASDELMEQGDDVRGFLRATQRGWQRVFGETEEAARLTVDEYVESGADYDHQLGMIEMQEELMTSAVTDQHGLLYMDGDKWERTNRLLVDTDVLSAPIDVEGLLDWGAFA